MDAGRPGARQRSTAPDADGRAAGLCLAMAVLTEHRVALVVPAVGWLLWRSSPSPRRRRRRLVAAAAYGGAWRVTALVTSGAPEAGGSSACSTGSALVACVLGGGHRGRRVRRAIGGRPDRAGPHRRRRLPGGGDRRAVGGATPSPDRLCLLGVCRPSAGVRRTIWTIVVAMVPLGAVLLAAGAQLVWVWHLEARLEPSRQAHPASAAVRRLDAAAPLVLAAAAVAPAGGPTGSRPTDVAADATAPLASACDWVVDNLNDAIGSSSTTPCGSTSSRTGRTVVARRVRSGRRRPDWRSYGYIVSTPRCEMPAFRLGSPAPSAAPARSPASARATTGSRCGASALSDAEAPTSQQATQDEARRRPGGPWRPTPPSRRRRPQSAAACRRGGRAADDGARHPRRRPPPRDRRVRRHARRGRGGRPYAPSSSPPSTVGRSPPVTPPWSRSWRSWATSLGVPAAPGQPGRSHQRRTTPAHHVPHRTGGLTMIDVRSNRWAMGRDD